MKPGVLPLIVGGVVLAAGLIIAGVSTFAVTKQVLEGSTIIDSTLEPNLGLMATIKDLPAGQELLLSLAGDPPDVPLQIRITQPDGTNLAAYDIDRTPFTTAAETRVTGDHTLEIRNVGSQSVSLSGALLNSPVTQQDGGLSIDDDPSLQTIVAYGVGVVVGLALIIAGIVLLIIGAIKYATGSKKAPGTSTVSG